jgi:hypothetical protein
MDILLCYYSEDENERDVTMELRVVMTSQSLFVELFLIFFLEVNLVNGYTRTRMELIQRRSQRYHRTSVER